MLPYLIDRQAVHSALLTSITLIVDIISRQKSNSGQLFWLDRKGDA